jgi:hypothetical protein
MAVAVLDDGAKLFADNVSSLALEEALFSASGYRSILGVIKHIGGWTHVYRSFAFDPEPERWSTTTWPRGLRDTIDPSDDYVREVIAWVEEGIDRWRKSVSALGDDDLARPAKLHWGEMRPLGNIVAMVANHVSYHTGELNMLLSIARQEAWEYMEEVEENHISTYGHGVRGAWMSEDRARRHEEALRVAHEAR